MWQSVIFCKYQIMDFRLTTKIHYLIFTKYNTLPREEKGERRIETAPGFKVTSGTVMQTQFRNLTQSSEIRK